MNPFLLLKNLRKRFGNNIRRVGVIESDNKKAIYIIVGEDTKIKVPKKLWGFDVVVARQKGILGMFGVGPEAFWINKKDVAANFGSIESPPTFNGLGENVAKISRRVRKRGYREKGADNKRSKVNYLLANREQESKRLKDSALRYPEKRLSALRKAGYMIGGKEVPTRRSKIPLATGRFNNSATRAKILLANRTSLNVSGPGEGGTYSRPVRTEGQTVDPKLAGDYYSEHENWEDWIDKPFRHKNMPQGGGKDPRKAGRKGR